MLEGASVVSSTFPVLDTRIAVVTMETALGRVRSYVDDEVTGHLVTFANVHMVVEARRDPAFLDILDAADLNCPDGKPLSWLGRLALGDQVSQVSGPEFMPLFCEQNVARGYRHFIFGGADGISEQAAMRLSELYPGIAIAGTYSPPFRKLTADEEEGICRRINESGAQLVWVCLGCPKQEKWMYAHRKRLHAKVLLGVGQAVDILAASRVRAPEWIRKMGLEWAYRLVSEPRRLWKRYLVTNSLFLFWLVRDRLLGRRPGIGPRPESIG